jgi:hypothetical protein
MEQLLNQVKDLKEVVDQQILPVHYLENLDKNRQKMEMFMLGE